MHKLSDLIQTRIKNLKETNPTMTNNVETKLSIDTPIQWVDINLPKPNPKNANVHPEEQIKRLAEIIKYQGFRHPIIVDEDMVIWAGHGRLEAAKGLGLTKVPIQVHKFENEEQAYAFLVSDNSIASWASLDFSLINMEIENLGPDFDIDLLGIKDFKLDLNEFPSLNEKQSPEEKDNELKTCPNCGIMIDG